MLSTTMYSSGDKKCNTTDDIKNGLQPHHHIRILRECVKCDGFVSLHLENYLSEREKTVSEREIMDVKSKMKDIDTLKTILNEFASIIGYNLYINNIYTGENEQVIHKEFRKVFLRLTQWMRSVYDLLLKAYECYDLYVYNIDEDSDWMHYPGFADPLLVASIPDYEGPNLFYTQTSAHIEKCIKKHSMLSK